MNPIILTNAYLRPRAFRSTSGISLSVDRNAYSCVEELIEVIINKLKSTPIMLPTTFDKETVSKILDHIDGILLPGAISNIHPRNYGDEPEVHPQIFDESHDATDMFLIKEAKERGIPFLGICRAMQAMNVVFGGTLHQKIASNLIDHKCSYPCNGTLDEPQYMHDIKLAPDGVLSNLFDCQSQRVNSMHEQGINKLGNGLFIEATAEDGVIEAISWPGTNSFFLSVQWHPETLPDHLVSHTIFNAFYKSIEERRR